MRVLVLLVLCLPTFSQEVCRHCPVGDTLNSQFPEAPSQIKSSFFAKKWAVATAIQFSSSWFDVHETLKYEGTCALEGNNGFPEHVGAGELWGQVGVEMGANVLFRELSYRAPRSFGWIGYMTPTYATVLHLRGGIEWYQRCH